jgi:hypothetical protein
MAHPYTYIHYITHPGELCSMVFIPHTKCQFICIFNYAHTFPFHPAVLLDKCHLPLFPTTIDYLEGSPDISVGIATSYGLDRAIWVRFQERGQIFRRLWGPPILLPIKYVSQTLPPEVKRPKLTTHLHLVLRLRIRGSMYPLLYTSSWPTT